LALSFLDTNILLRHICQDDATRSPKASALISRIEHGALAVQTSDVVVFEAVFTLQHSYRFVRAAIAGALLSIIELPGVALPGKEQYRPVFELFVADGLGFADCYHVVLMRRLGISDILSFDAEFDRIPGIERREL
jgi:predicted nucleic acid-binding protein